ncbi:MAG: FKBP-type peptidyl-prolyl cis-trans isomerase [Terracidiphilus sp.]
MKPIAVVLIFLAAGFAAVAQTTPPASKPTTATKPSTTVKKPAAASGSSVVKLPPGVPRVRGVVKTAFSLRYQDIKIGTGADAEPNKIYKVLYTGWLAADGRKFDSSEDHRQPLRDKDGKPVMGEDGKPKLGDVQPISFPEGFGRVIPGFDQGFGGMKVGGKRRLFIPWQLAYGAHGHPGPDPAHPGIPPKADLIFDIELVDVSEMQMPMNHPTANPVHPGMTLPPGHQPMNPSAPGSAPANPGQPAAPGTGTATPAPTAKPATPTTATPTQPQPK